jgi:apolipoprotein N-acyltransferase
MIKNHYVIIEYLIGRYNILLSAVLYSVAFVFPSCCFFVFLFLVPLFYVVFRDQKIAFVDGFLWGLSVFLIQYHALFWFFLEHVQGSLRITAWFFLMLYIALYAGIWFWLSAKLSSYINPLIAWSLTSLGYFCAMTTFSLWIFGNVEGTIFSFPLLPLVYYPRWLVLLPCCGKFFLLEFLIIAQACCALSFVKKRIIYFMLSILFFFPFLYGWIMQEKVQNVPGWIDKVGFIAPRLGNGAHPLDYAENIMEQIHTLQKSPHINVIIGPESTFPFALNDCPRSIALWYENALHDDTHLILGSHKKGEDGKLYNSLYYITKGRIILSYDKTHLMPFTEQVPNAWRKILKNIHISLHKNKSFSRGERVLCPIQLPQGISLTPFICSELFFLDAAPPGLPSHDIVAIVNDSWFSCLSMKELMHMCACFKALEWKKNILYVSHTYQTYITKDGLRHILKNPC